jgi:DNA-binding CsgD family transcriptional regulator
MQTAVRAPPRQRNRSDRLFLSPQGSAHLDSLSERERDVLRLIAQGRTSNEIAQTLYISTHTVQTHRDHIMEKLNLHRKAELIRYAIRTGLVGAEE